METTTDLAPPSADEHEAFLVGIASTVLRNWRIVLLLPLLLGVGVGVWSITRDRTYVVSASFMPQAAESRAPVGAAALAQQLGFSLGSERPGQNSQFYVDLLRSRTILREAVESRYELPTQDGQPWEGTLVEYWELDQRSAALPPWRQAIEILRRNLLPLVSRETGVVRLSVSADHPLLAEQIAEKLLALLNERNLELRQNRALEEARFIAGRMDEARGALVEAETALQNFLRSNREFRNSPELAFEYDRLQRDLMMRQEVYTALLQSQEQARIDGIRDTPLFTVLDAPAGAAEPEPRGTVTAAAVAFLVGLMLAVLIAGLMEYDRRRRLNGDPTYQELRGVAKEAWRDVRHPRRWMRQSGRARDGV